MHSFAFTFFVIVDQNSITMGRQIHMFLYIFLYVFFVCTFYELVSRGWLYNFLMKLFVVTA